MIVGYGLVAALGGIGWWLITRRGLVFTGVLFIGAAGLALIGTGQGMHIFTGISTATNGLAVGVAAAFGH